MSKPRRRGKKELLTDKKKTLGNPKLTNWLKKQTPPLLARHFYQFNISTGLSLDLNLSGSQKMKANHVNVL